MTFKFGRRQPVAIGPHVKFSSLVAPEKLPPRPHMAVDYTQKAERSLSMMYLNDQLGDCVPAEMAHTAGVATANAGVNELILRNKDIVLLYERIGGYDPRHPQATDNGCDLQTALNYWMRFGLFPNNPSNAHKIEMWVSVDATNIEEVLTALWLFESLMPGIGLPDEWVNNLSTLMAGDIWDIAGPPDLNNGHCPGFFGYDSDGNILVSTWGMIIKMTQRAVQYYCAPEQGGELYAPLYPDVIVRATQRAPSGFDFPYLEQLSRLIT